MKNPIFILFIILLNAVPLPAQKTLWRYGTSRTLPMGQQEFGIIHPFQIGATDKLEISAQPLLGLTLSPNVSFKYSWLDGSWGVASRHAFSMPTQLIRTLAYLPWDASILRPQHEIPYVFNFRNEGIITKQIATEMLITARAGFEFSLKAWGDSSIPAVTAKPFYRLLYLRSTTLNKKLLWYAGAQYDVNIYKDFNAMADLFFYSSGWFNGWAIEHKGYFIWNKSNKFAALIGYKMGYGTYPEETFTALPANHFFIFPVADLIWKLNVKRQPQKDLFRVR